MKKIILVLLFSCLGLNMGWAQSILSFKQEKDRVLFTTANGELQLYPLANNAIRVKFVKQQPTMPEWIYVETPTPAYKIKKEKGLVSICLSNLRAQVDMQTGKITFLSSKGDVLLMEKERELSPSSVQDMKTSCAMQAFYSAKDEALFGLGQFQDGYLNVRGLSRRLTQVNTQISIPFIMSNKGYGILWNNYGLTDFNPADHKVNLVHKGTSGDAVMVDVTSTEGRKKEVRSSSVFSSLITIPTAGHYSIMLDVGQPMARKHHLRIGDKTVFDMSNVWLPPTTSAIIELEAGTHKIEAELEKDDQPTVYFKEVEDKTVFRSPTADCIDYTFFAGNADDVIAAYRNTTGEVPMMPKWALGYIHCRELLNVYQRAPEKDLIFTESSIGTWNNGHDLTKTLLSNMESIGIGTINNYCSAVTIWNLMLETDFNGSIPSNNGGQPNRPGGCQTCFGAVDLNMSDLKTIYMNSHYYMICHLSAVVRPGAIRIGTSGYTDNDIAYSAFKNTDGSYAFVIINKSSSDKNIVLTAPDDAGKKHSASCTLQPRSVNSFKWK